MVVTACSEFGLTVSKAKTEIMCLQTKGGGKVSFTINAAGQVYKQTIEFAYLGGAITADRELSIEITRRLQRAWARFQRYQMKIYDHPGVRLRLKVRLLQAEVIDTLLYGCMTWSPNKPDYDRLRRVHHSMLLRCLGWRKRKRDDHTLPYADALAKTASESIEAIEQTMAGYDGFTTPCSSDASDGGNRSATITPYLAPMRLPRQLPSA